MNVLTYTYRQKKTMSRDLDCWLVLYLHLGSMPCMTISSCLHSTMSLVNMAWKYGIEAARTILWALNLCSPTCIHTDRCTNLDQKSSHTLTSHTEMSWFSVDNVTFSGIFGFQMKHYYPSTQTITKYIHSLGQKLTDKWNFKKWSRNVRGKWNTDELSKPDILKIYHNP